MGAIRMLFQILKLLQVDISVSEGLFLAQYQVLRKNGHTPSEAFNETVEEATQSLYPLIGQKGYVAFILLGVLLIF